MNKNTSNHEGIKAVHIHLALKDEYLTEDQKRMLRRGCSEEMESPQQVNPLAEMY